MNQGEFTHILDKKIKPFVSDVIRNAAFEKDKSEYISIAWKKLSELLGTFDFDVDTYNDLNVRYSNKIQLDIRKKYKF